MLFTLIFFTLLLIFLSLNKLKIKLSIGWVILFSVYIRLLILLIFPGSRSEDLQSFITAGRIVLEKKPIYSSLYFPFFPYVGALVILLKNFINPLILLKILFSLFDVGIVYLVYLLTENSLLALMYALNPPTIINTTIHGQFDTVPLFFLLLGIYLFKKNASLSSMLSLSFAVFTKTWPLLFIMPLFRKTKTKFIFIYIILFPTISVILHSLIFKISPLDILLPIKNYRGLPAVWGTTLLISFLLPNLPHIFNQIIRRFLLVVFLIFSLVFPFSNLAYAYEMLLLFFFVITPTFGAQWLTWTIPFLIMTRPKGYKYFFMVSTFYLGLTFYPNVYSISNNLVSLWENSVKIIGVITWLIICYMLYSNYRKGAKINVR